MRILDWLKAARSSPGEASGERVNKAVLNRYRVSEGLPEQKSAILIDKDGKEHYHDLDIQKNGEPHGEVKIVLYLENGARSEKMVYAFSHEENDAYLVYKEV